MVEFYCFHHCAISMGADNSEREKWKFNGGILKFVYAFGAQFNCNDVKIYVENLHFYWFATPRKKPIQSGNDNLPYQ